jgi:hypothetical protein
MRRKLPILIVQPVEEILKQIPPPAEINWDNRYMMP